MNLKLVLSRVGKYRKKLSELNQKEGWGFPRSILTYFDYFGAFLMHGCLVDQYTNGKFYTYRNYYRKRIITQRRLERMISVANSSGAIHLLENKAHFNRHFKKWVSRKWLDSELMTFDDFVDICKDNKALFIKPLDACEGKGIQRVELPENEAEIKTMFDILKHGHYIVEQELVQHPQMIFGNKSINTLRINTLYTRGGVICFKPVLRAGIGNAFVDNYNAGGVEYAVDLDTGIITMPGFYKGEMSQVYHPGTDIKMVGYQIPRWQEVIANVKEAAKHIPECRYVGWDVAITPDSIELIEGNHNPGYVCMEYFGETGWYAKLKKYL